MTETIDDIIETMKKAGISDKGLEIAKANLAAGEAEYNGLSNEDRGRYFWYRILNSGKYNSLDWIGC